MLNRLDKFILRSLFRFANELNRNGSAIWLQQKPALWEYYPHLLTADHHQNVITNVVPKELSALTKKLLSRNLDGNTIKNMIHFATREVLRGNLAPADVGLEALRTLNDQV